MLYVKQATSRYPENTLGLKNIFTENTFLPQLTPPLCLHGMPDVVNAVEKLEALTMSEISTIVPEQARQLMLTISNDILRPVAVFLWCQLECKDNAFQEKKPKSLSICLKDLETHLAGPVVDNMWLLYRACENASNGNETFALAEMLRIAIDRVNVLFQNVESVMLSGFGFQYFGEMADNSMQDEGKSPFSLKTINATAQPQKDSFDWNGLRMTYSLFGGKSAWSFNEPESNFLTTQEEYDGLKMSGETIVHSLPNANTSTLKISNSFHDEHFGLPVGQGPSSASWLPPSTNALSRSLTVPTASSLSARGCNGENAYHRPISSSFSSVSTGNFSSSTETDGYSQLASALGCLDLGSFGDEDGDWQKPPVRYKTAMCKRVLDGRKCRYSKACGFAHSEMEKDRYASLHLATVRCTFGSRCRNVCCGRAHGASEQQLAIKVYNNAVERGRGNVSRQVYK